MWRAIGPDGSPQQVASSLHVVVGSSPMMLVFPTHVDNDDIWLQLCLVTAEDDSWSYVMVWHGALWHDDGG